MHRSDPLSTSTWGTAADLVDILDVRRTGDRRFEGIARADEQRHVVEGSQILAQAMVAAARQTQGRRAVSAHMAFARAGDANQPLWFDLDEISAGRTFTALSVTVGQGDRLCASGTLLLDVTAPDVIRHASEPPRVAVPDGSIPCEMAMAGREVRVVDGAYTDDPDAPVGPPVIDTWVRFDDVPPDPDLHVGLLVQFTGHMSIASALRPHPGIGQTEAHRTLSTAVNAIYVSVHAEIRADRWMLYHHHSTFAGAGMTHSQCTVHSEDGDLLASFCVDAMLRSFAKKTSGLDPRTAL